MAMTDRTGRLTQVLRRQAGFMLIEQLTVAAMLIMVVSAIFGLYRVSVNEQSRVQGSASGLQAQRVGIEKMTRELRKASVVCHPYPTCGESFSNLASIDFKTCSVSSPSGCSELWVRYNCSGSPVQAVPPALTARACLRSESTAPGNLGANESIVIGDVATSPTGIFSFTSPSYVAISMRVVTKGAKNPVSIQDGVRLRNVIGS
jgi:Tfp pilus assembly protein PilW